MFLELVFSPAGVPGYYTAADACEKSCLASILCLAVALVCSVPVYQSPPVLLFVVIFLLLSAEYAHFSMKAYYTPEYKILHAEMKRAEEEEERRDKEKERLDLERSAAAAARAIREREAFWRRYPNVAREEHELRMRNNAWWSSFWTTAAAGAVAHTVAKR